jgi:hypothetical protein
VNAPAHPFTGVLAEIARVAGEDAARALSRARGGTQIYLPPEPAPDHWLSQLVGHDRALAIADQLTCGVGGMRLEIPLGDTGYAASGRAKIDAMIRDNFSERDIALATGYTTRAVRRRRKKLRENEESQQLDLF